MSEIWVYPSPPPRGALELTAEQSALLVDRFAAQECNLTTAWGSSPASTTITYVRQSDSWAPIATGSLIVIAAGGHSFGGICMLDTQESGSGGRTRILEWRDTREFLTWDICYGEYNMPDHRTVDGVRVRRYRHLLPADFNGGQHWYTTSPFSAAQIMQFIFNAATIQSPWRVYHCFGSNYFNGYHPDQVNYPVYEIDATGKTLGAVLQEIADKQGLLFGLVPLTSYYDLVFVRKGGTVDPLTMFPANSDQRRFGAAVSGAAQRVRVLGGRNRYQLMNVEMVPDWAPGWGAYYDRSFWNEFVYWSALNPATEKPFTYEENDPDQYIGRQKASAYASTLTLRDVQNPALFDQPIWVAPHPRLVPRWDTAAAYADYRLYSGKNRMDMPVALYLEQLLFRAFALPSTVNRYNSEGDLLDVFRMTNVYGQVVSEDAITIVPQILVGVSHDPVTGEMAAYADEPTRGNGYVIAQGYQVGSDAFATIRPERFDPSEWMNLNTLWQHVQFQIDDSGEGTSFLIFDEPVITTPDLVSRIDGYAVINANASIRIPRVFACLTVEAERFSWIVPRDSRQNLRDVCVQVSGLNGEMLLLPNNTWQELPYADGRFSPDKAVQYALPLLQKPYDYAEGGYRVQGSNITRLTALTDRVTLHVGPDGMFEQVDFTNERSGSAFEPERDLDRRRREENLLPGQEELQAQARAAQLLARGLRQAPKFRKVLSEALRGPLGSDAALVQVLVR